MASGGAFYTSQQEIGFYCTRFTVYELFAQIFFASQVREEEEKINKNKHKNATANRCMIDNKKIYSFFRLSEQSMRILRSVIRWLRDVYEPSEQQTQQSMSANGEKRKKSDGKTVFGSDLPFRFELSVSCD